MAKNDDTIKAGSSIKDNQGRKYKVQRQIGEGSMGSVFLANDKKGKTVVIKTFKTSEYAEPEEKQRLARSFANETNTLDKMSNLVGSGPGFIVMTKLEGKDLSKIKYNCQNAAKLDPNAIDPTLAENLIHMGYNLDNQNNEYFKIPKPNGVNLEGANVYLKISPDGKHHFLSRKDFETNIEPNTIASTQVVDINTKNQMTYGLIREMYLKDLKGINHNDLGPDNIFYNQETNKVELFDYGEAEIYGAPSPPKGKGLIAIPPEFIGKFDQSFSTSPKTDMYSFGITVIAIYMDKNINDIKEEEIKVVLEQTTPPLGMPNEIFEMVKHCCQTNPDNRPDIITKANGIKNSQTQALKDINGMQVLTDKFRNDMLKDNPSLQQYDKLQTNINLLRRGLENPKTKNPNEPIFAMLQSIANDSDTPPEIQVAINNVCEQLENSVINDRGKIALDLIQTNIDHHRQQNPIGRIYNIINNNTNLMVIRAELQALKQDNSINLSKHERHDIDKMCEAIEHKCAQLAEPLLVERNQRDQNTHYNLNDVPSVLSQSDSITPFSNTTSEIDSIGDLEDALAEKNETSDFKDLADDIAMKLEDIATKLSAGRLPSQANLGPPGALRKIARELNALENPSPEAISELTENFEAILGNQKENPKIKDLVQDVKGKIDFAREQVQTPKQDQEKRATLK